ncbi:MAG TPA: hypothetical protein DCE42_03980, partial [Myxococcales bacterium]|nr:hypothetical protein [Myxococcales bacterium]
PGGPPPAMSRPMGGPSGPMSAGGNASGSWNEVSMQNGPSYHYLSVQGGWIVSSPNGLLFISDPSHQYPPTPQ